MVYEVNPPLKKQYIYSVTNNVGIVVREVVSLYRINNRLCSAMQDRADNANDSVEKEKLSKTHSDLLSLRKKVRDLLVRFYRLQRDLEITVSKKFSKAKIRQKFLDAQELTKEGIKLEKRIYEIGGQLYGDENWKPDEEWVALGEDALDESAIRSEALSD